MRVEVDGLARFINRLEKFDPEVSKILKSDMRSAASLVAAASKRRLPDSGLRNWGAWWNGNRDLGYIGSWVRGGVSVVTNRYRRSGVTVGFGYDVINKTPSGNIYEVIGSKRRVTGRRGARFVDNVNAKHGSGPLPRTLFPAYYDAMPQTRSLIEAAIREAERKVGL